MAMQFLGPFDDVAGVKRRVLVIVTGGTITMHRENNESTDLICSPIADYLKNLPELDDPSLPEVDIKDWDELFDSSDATEVEWNKMATQIAQNYDDYDGFVICHGTDTLAYTASILSFTLENLGKPVVLTGSMRPISHALTDARRNFVVSVMTAGWSCIPEVVIVFGTSILRGCRATKTSCGNFEAFSSYDYPALGKIGVDVTIREQLLLDPPRAEFNAFTSIKRSNILVVQILPGCRGLMLEGLSSVSARPLALILELFGTGTAPMRDGCFFEAIEKLITNDVVVLAITQCDSGTAALRSYPNGKKLLDMGVIEGKDMTVEAAFAKLAYLMSKGYSSTQIRDLATSNLRGEMTEYRRRIASGVTTNSPPRPDTVSSPFLENRRSSGDRAGVRILGESEVCRYPAPTLMVIDRHAEEPHGV